MYINVYSWREGDIQHPDTLSSARISSADRMPHTLFMWGMVLPNHFIFGGSKEWHDSWLHSKGICRIGCCCHMPETPSVPGSPPDLISHDPVAAISSWVSCYMLIIPTAPKKLCFVICAVRFYHHSAHRRPCISIFFVLCKKFIDVVGTRWLEN